MNISNNILVGVQYPKLVSFYGTIVHYAAELTLKYPELIDHTLLGLVIYSDDNGLTVEEIFYTSYEENIYITKAIGYRETNSVIWHDPELTDKLKMFNKITSQNHILDLEYYLQNN